MVYIVMLTMEYKDLHYHWYTVGMVFLQRHHTPWTYHAEHPEDSDDQEF